MSPARAPGHNVTMNSGRHATGQALARPGDPRPGQGPHSSGNTPGTGYNPKTSSTPRMTPRAPVLTNQNTSAQAQQQIMQPPQPFANPYGTVNVPASANQNFKSLQTHSQPAKNLHGGSSRAAYNIKEIGCGNTTPTSADLAAVGYDRRPAGYNVVNYFRGPGNRQTGQPGTNTNRKTSARENARVRQGS
jgi:hypothetical protein